MTRVVLTAYYDDDTGELDHVKFTSHFTCEDALMRADVLQDLLRALEDAYDRSRRALHEELDRARAAVTPQEEN